MPNPDKTFGWYMHQKTPYKFNTRKCQFFPLSFIPVILDRKSNIFIVHTDDTVIADVNPMGIFSKVINHRRCTVKSFLAARNPFRIITGIHQLFESIMITIFFHFHGTEVIPIMINPMIIFWHTFGISFSRKIAGKL